MYLRVRQRIPINILQFYFTFNIVKHVETVQIFEDLTTLMQETQPLQNTPNHVRYQILIMVFIEVLQILDQPDQIISHEFSNDLLLTFTLHRVVTLNHRHAIVQYQKAYYVVSFL